MRSQSSSWNVTIVGRDQAGGHALVHETHKFQPYPTIDSVQQCSWPEAILR